MLLGLRSPAAVAAAAPSPAAPAPAPAAALAVGDRPLEVGSEAGEAASPTGAEPGGGTALVPAAAAPGLTAVGTARGTDKHDQASYDNQNSFSHDQFIAHQVKC